ncbi:MAG: hypothetical protein Q4B36_06970 [Tissierellia bacterium]|nr:hypothetical protein [Tissierellia bacterium]
MNIKNQKVNKSYNIKKSKKNWLELTDEELRKLRTNTVCMYGGKDDNPTRPH